MARRIIRRRRAARQATVRAEEVRPQGTGLPEAKIAPATRVLIATPVSISTILSSQLSGSTTVKMVAMAQSEAVAVEKMITEDVDVAAIHIHLGGQLQGLEIARSVAKACPEAGILILVDSFDGIDLRRHARMFGTAWSYVALGSAQKDHAFGEMVSGVGRGIHWIDPGLKRVMDAVWQVASEGRDLEMADALGELESTADASSTGTLIDPPESAPRKGGIQTMRSGNSGIGSSAGIRGVNRAA